MLKSINYTLVFEGYYPILTMRSFYLRESHFLLSLIGVVLRGFAYICNMKHHPQTEKGAETPPTDANLKTITP